MASNHREDAENGELPSFSNDDVNDFVNPKVECTLWLWLETAQPNCVPVERKTTKMVVNAPPLARWELSVQANAWTATQWRSAATLRVYGVP